MVVGVGCYYYSMTHLLFQQFVIVVFDSHRNIGYHENCHEEFHLIVILSFLQTCYITKEPSPLSVKIGSHSTHSELTMLDQPPMTIYRLPPYYCIIIWFLLKHHKVFILWKIYLFQGSSIFVFKIMYHFYKCTHSMVFVST